MTVPDVLIYAAAAWYLTYAITQTSGPFHVFELVRKWLPLGGLTTCIVCLSVWVALGLVLIGRNPVTDALAIAGVALWFHSYTGWRMTI